MKRTFYACRAGRRGTPIEEPQRWAELARVARGWVADQYPIEHVRYVLNRTRVIAPLGPPGDLNPCTRLAEEVRRRLAPPRPDWSPGIDREALTADNRDEILRWAQQVDDRFAAHQAVSDAAKQVR